MGRPRWYPDAKTIQWIVTMAEREARKARALASDDAKRRLYHGAIEQDARAGALEDLVASIAEARAEREPANHLEQGEACAEACS